MNSAYDATQSQLRFTDLPGDKTPAGPVATGVTMLAATDDLEVGVWEHPVGTSTDVETDEVFVVLEGRGTVTDQHGNVIELAPGVVGALHPDDVTTWVITESLRKVWIIRSGD